ncbi:SH3 domain-containing protein [Devosia sp. YIM 151766]|uniref:SH3 domain-containing protein n=1 Tax=Devosia sp. YIM 151766 TaxID=3017325 RepID=UPI00255CEF07|nr:SH3 domain-containing protein [Devosia sp. YIM 151766]WIY51841.1 SH3 domain-containing protein [Devosia sp. YIM 151766]
MHRQTRKKLLNIVTGIAVAAAAALVFLPAAQAAPGAATANVNVRSGPGTSHGVISTLHRGQQVDVQRCQGSWCLVRARGVNGWVSASYLSTSGRPVNPSNPGLSFGFTIGGPDGPQINIGVGNQPQRPGPRPPPIVRPVAEVCFFDRTNFRGTSICAKQGESIRDLGNWTDRISSINNPSRVRVEVCSEVAFRNCRTYSTSASSLGDFDKYIASIRVR